MGKGGKSPKAPSYNYGQATQSAKETARYNTLLQQYGLESPFGTVGFTGEVGTPERRQVIGLSPFTQALMTGAQGIVPQISGGIGDEASRRAEEAVYGQFATRFEPQYRREQSTLHTQLVNQGIPVGSEAYNRAMGGLQEQQNLARLQAQNQATLTGQQTQAQQLQNALSAFGTLLTPIQAITGQRIGTATGQMEDPYQQAYNAALQRYQIQQQQQSGLFGALGSLGGGILGLMAGGPAGAAAGMTAGSTLTK